MCNWFSASGERQCISNSEHGLENSSRGADEEFYTICIVPVKFLTRLYFLSFDFLPFFLNKKLKLKFRILTDLDWPNTAQIFIGILPWILTTSAFTFLSKTHNFL